MKDGLSSLLKQAQAMQSQMQQAQADLKALEVTGEAGAGLVKVIMTGRHDAKKVILDPSLLAEEITLIEDLVAAAINDAVQKIDCKANEKFAGMAQGLSLPFPADFKLPF